MSANNFWYIAHDDGQKYYGWDEMAEASSDDKPDRVLSKANADVTGDSLEDVTEKLTKQGLGYAEYGTQIHPFQAHLPKDGTPIEVVD